MAEFKRLEDLGRGSYRVQDEGGDVFTYNENSGNRGPTEFNVFAQGETPETSPRDFRPEGPPQGAGVHQEVLDKMVKLYGIFSGVSELDELKTMYGNETAPLPTKGEAFPGNINRNPFTKPDVSTIKESTDVSLGGIPNSTNDINETVGNIMTMGKTFKGMVTDGINKAIDIYKYPSTPEEIEEWNSVDKMLEDDARNKRLEKYKRHGKAMGFSDEPYWWKNRDTSLDEEI